MTFFMFKEDTRKKQFVALRMDNQLYSRLQNEAQQRGEDVSSVIRECITERLVEYGNNKT